MGKKRNIWGRKYTMGSREFDGDGTGEITSP
jgi:hypothetical protein